MYSLSVFRSINSGVLWYQAYAVPVIFVTGIKRYLLGGQVLTQPPSSNLHFDVKVCSASNALFSFARQAASPL